MGRFPKPCRICGNLSLGNLCATHQAESDRLHNIRRDQVKKQTGQYSGDYRKRAALIRATAIICHTVKGKGVGFTENNLKWHHKSGLKENEMRELLAALEEA